MTKKLKVFGVILLFGLILMGCGAQGPTDTGEKNKDDKWQIVATTTMLADMAEQIGGDKVSVTGLMGPGIDPHLYKASAGDVKAMQNADMVVYSGLHLEGKMGDIFEALAKQDKKVVMISKGLSEEKLIADEETGAHDPHIWFDVMLWKEAMKNLYDGLVELDPANKDFYQKNYAAHQKEMDDLDAYIKEQVAKIPEDARVLVTAHDAFEYFGRAYDFQVMGLQGISTASEAGTRDVNDLASFIAQHKIKAIFVESSVPKKNVEALQEAVKAKGFDVSIGGELYSDSLGSEGTQAGNYIGTVKENIDTIVGALK